MKNFTKSRNFGVVVATLVFLFLVYFFYLFVYTEIQEKQIIDTRFRSLSNIGNNIKEKKKALEGGIVASLVSDSEKQLEMFLSNPKNNKLLETPRVSRYLKVADSLLIKLKSKYPSITGKTEVYKITVAGGGSSYRDVDTLDQRYLYFKDKILNVIDTTKTDALATDELTADIIKTDTPKTDTLKIEISFRIQIDYLMDHILTDDLFVDFLLIRDSDVVFNTGYPDLLLSKIDISSDNNFKSLLEKNPVLFDKFKGDYSNLINIPDSNKPGFMSLHSGKIYNVTIANTDFKLFYKPITMDDNEIWHLGGLMTTSDYNSSRRSVAPWLIIILSFVMLMMLLSMPVIKIFVIGKFEQLNSTSIISAVLAIIIGVPVLVAYLIFFYQNLASDQRINKELVELNDDIESVFYKEIDDIYHQMAAYETDFNRVFDADTLRYAPGSLKWFIRKVSDIHGPVIKHKTNILAQNNNIAYPDIYPYFDYVFWTSEEGMQEFMIKPTSIPGALHNMGHRDYFKYKDSWYLPDDHAVHENQKFRIESIYSNTTGEGKVAVSKKWMATNTLDNTELEVVATTARMYSVIDAILPKGYGFSIIDETGKVWFHNNKHRNLKENFIEECDNDATLTAAIYSNTARKLDLQYYNSTHPAYIQPLRNIPLYLVTFYDFKNEKSFQLQTFSMTFFFYGLLLFMIFFQVLIFLVINSSIYRSMKKHMLIEIIRPKKPDTLRYIKNVHINVAITFLLMVFLFFTNGLYSIFMVFFAIAAAFTYSYLFLNHHQTQPIHKKTIIRVAMVLLFGIDVLLILFTSNNKSGVGDLIKVFVFEIVLIAVIFGFSQWLVLNKEYNKQIIRLYKRNYLRYYTNYIITNLFLIGVIPVLVFYQVSYTEEIRIRVKHNQYDLAQKIEEHKIHQLAYYKGIELENVELLNDRIRMGIHSTHCFNTAYFDGEIADPWITVDTTHNDSGVVVLKKMTSDSLEIVDDHHRETDNNPTEITSTEPGKALDTIHNDSVAVVSENMNSDPSETDDDHHHDTDNNPAEKASTEHGEAAGASNDHDGHDHATSDSLASKYWKTVDTTNHLWSDLISFIRPIYGDYSKENKFFAYSFTQDSVYRWRYADSNNALTLYYKADTLILDESEVKLRGQKYHSITSILPAFGYLNLADNSQFTTVGKFAFNMMFWIILALLLWTIWLLVSRGASRVFAIQIIESYTPFAFEKHLKHLIETRKYIGLVSSSPLDIDELKTFVNKETDAVTLVAGHFDDNKTLLKQFGPDKRKSNESRKKTLLVHPFDTFFLDTGNNKNLLEVLNKVDETNSQIILVLHKRPGELISILNELQEDNADELTKNQNYQWRFFFDHFSMVDIPLEYEDDAVNKQTLDISGFKLPPTKKAYFKHLCQHIIKECTAANYLRPFAQPVWEYIYPLTDGLDLPTAKEWSSKKLMELSMAYYNDIFRALSPAEKFIMYDLASNSVMNLNNYSTIAKLLKQGYLTKEIDKIQIMNQSFQMFILSVFSKKEAKQLVKSEPGGAWAGFKIPLILIIIALFVMIGLGNQQFISDLNKFLLVIGAGVTSITTIIGIATKSKKVGGGSPT